MISECAFAIGSTEARSPPRRRSGAHKSSAKLTRQAASFRGKQVRGRGVHDFAGLHRRPWVAHALSHALFRHVVCNNGHPLCSVLRQITCQRGYPRVPPSGLTVRSPLALRWHCVLRDCCPPTCVVVCMRVAALLEGRGSSSLHVCVRSVLFALHQRDASSYVI